MDSGTRHLSAAVFRVRGRVQGVGFRWWSCAEGERLGLDGTVRNLADGGVEVRASGSPEKLELLARALQTGPPGARVDDLERNPLSAPLPRGFHILRD